MNSPCFSPSRGGTQDFLRCPRLYGLKKRWEPYPTEKPEIEDAQLMGNQLHAYLAAKYIGVDYPGGLPEALKPVAREALGIDLLWKGTTVLAVEQEMGPEKCHPDLVLRHEIYGQGGHIYQTWLQVVDWKFSLKLYPEYVAPRLRSYETSWQLHHYAWRVQQEYGLPCKQVTIVQMALQPKPLARAMTWELTPEAIERWAEDAEKVWVLMDLEYNAHNPEGCLKYGEGHRCEFYDGCWLLHADESKFDTLYRRK